MGARIALVRHGETAWNAEKRLQGQTDIELNDAGRAQARAAAGELERLGHDGGAWDLLVSSPLGRAAETAAIIGGQLGLEAIAPVQDLQERHYGEGEGRVVEGMDRAEVARLLATAEPEDKVTARALEALRGIIAANPESNMVVVAHGTLIRLVVGSLLDLRHPHVENGQVVEIDADLLEVPEPGDVAGTPDVQDLTGAPSGQRAASRLSPTSARR
ncbi:histidine phosphatase family protein [Micrococcaceae bacterium RIT802]|nr:histidine phosphatase family protein [Micrococcaceae bacterium RIT 802]